MIQNFNDLFVELKAKNICKKMVAAWAVDEHTIEAASLATDMGFVKCVLVGDEDLIKKVCADNNIDVAKFEIVDIKDELKAVAQAVKMVHDGEGEVLMKGLCSTDKFLRAILNKETGLLPPKGVLSHVGVIENPNYHKLVFISDMAVIPLPDFRQKVKLAGYLVSTAKSFGIAKPKIAFIAASEQMLDSMPACIEGAMLAKMCDRGQIKGCIGDGPLALDVAIDQESVEIKKLVSPVAGDADCLLFPNIESANVFWKTNSKLAVGVRQAGFLVGPMGSHRRKWGWWLVAAIAVAVAASLFLHRRPVTPATSDSAVSVEAESAGAVVRDTVYVTVDDESVPVVRERKVEAGESREEAPAGAETPAAEEAPAAAVETVIAVPVKVLNGLLREKSGRDVTLSTQAPDRIILTYAGKVDVPMLGEQGMNFSAGFKVLEVQGDRLVLQIDSGAAINAAADLLAPRILERLPAGLVDSFANGRAVINLSAIPTLQKQLKSMEIVGFSLDENAIRLRTVEK